MGDIVHDPRILASARKLLGISVKDDLERRWCVEANSCLFYERGSAQGLHVDLWYRLGTDNIGGMVGAWFAFDDTDQENGPLFYVPGSHVHPSTNLIMSPTASQRYLKLSLPSSFGPTDKAALYARFRASILDAGLEERAFEAR